MKSPRNIVLTGASGGLGRALAEALAGPERALLLFGRSAERLDEVRAVAEAKGATVTVAQTDLRDQEAVAEMITGFDAASPIDLFIANAGVKCGNVDGIEPASQLQRVVDVNLTAALFSLQCALPQMLARGRGQIALISSLAARSPQGALLSYSATKAALEAYATALRRKCRGRGVAVSIIRPGFIDTPMTDRQRGPTPMMISSEAAAHRICRGLEKGRPVIAFPRRLAVLAELERLLPLRLADAVAQRLDAEIVPDADERLASETSRDRGA